MLDKKQKFKLRNDVICLKNTDEEYVIFSQDNSDETFIKLKGCDSDIFELLVTEKPFSLEEFKLEIKNNFEMSGIELDEYLDKYLELLYENKLINNV